MRIATLKIINPLSIKFLMIIILLELFLGGGGRLIDVGPLSLRMYFFILSLLLSVLFISARVTVNKSFLFLVLATTLLLVASSIIGVLNGAEIGKVLNDVKPLLSIYFLFFLYFMIQTKDDVMLVIKLLKFSAVLMAVLYLIVFVLINTKTLPFMSFYNSVSHTEEFFFRDQYAFFYKGFIYVCVGLFFFIVNKNIKVAAILLAAIVLTFTRGFLLAIMLSYLFYLIFIKKSALKLIVISFFLTVAVFLVWELIYAKIDRSYSDSARFVQIEEVFEEVTPVSTVIGHGFGIGVPSRPERMEIAYLEIFHKQGLIGLSFWCLLFGLNWFLFQRAANKDNFQLAVPFMLSVVLIYVQSFTNPYLNNPIGLTMILVSLVCLNVLGKDLNANAKVDVITRGSR